MKCHRCKYSKPTLPGGYLACHHPFLNEPAVRTAIPDAIDGRTSPERAIQALKEIGVTINSDGVRRGVVAFPLHYNQAYVTDCQFFAEPGYTTLGFGVRGPLKPVRLKGDWDSQAQLVRKLATRLLAAGWTAAEVAREIESMAEAITPPIAHILQSGNAFVVWGEGGKYEFKRPRGNKEQKTASP